jgi:LuxR family glucitol operon transcriptional activator
MIEFLSGALANIIGEFVADKVGDQLSTEAERRTLSRALDEAVARAERQFVAEHGAHDPELVAALTRDTRFADLPSVRAALRGLLTQPFHDPSGSVAVLQHSFADVLPTTVERERVDAVVRAFLGTLGREVLYIPQLRELYALSFQKISAESARATAENTAAAARQMQALTDGFRDLQESLRLLAAAPETRLLPAPRPGVIERPRPWHNLPQRGYSAFIGRHEELAQLDRLLLPHPRSRHFIVTIDGIGGVGKSALALELAYRHRDGHAALPGDERFAAIVWVSAKRTLLTAGGIQQRRQSFNTLDDLFREVATVLEQPAILQAPLAERRGLVVRALAAQRTLLILDNLETVDDEELLSFLRELPDPTKALVTTRHRIDIAYAVRLTGMAHADALKLMAVEADAKGVILNGAEMDELERRTGGVPLAIQWSIGLMSLGHSVEGVLRRLGSGQSDIARFCFAESVALIRGRDAHRLLLALALFERSVSRAMLAEVAGLADDPVGRDDGLAQLLRLSLVNQKGDRFKLLPLTHAFARDELAGHPALEQGLREGWVACLSRLASAYGGNRWRGIDRTQLLADGPHFLTLAEWCRRTHSYQILQTITFGLVRYFDLLGQWDEALQTARSALEQARLAQDSAMMVDLMIFPIVWVLRGQQRFEEAERNINEAIDLAAQIDDSGRQSDALIAYSNVLRNQGQFDRARACCDRAAELLPSVDPAYRVYIQANIEYELGHLARDRGDWTGAERHLLAVRDLFSQPERDPIFTTEFGWGLYRQLGTVAERRGELERAIQLYEQSLSLGRTTGMGAHEANVLVRVARLELQLGRSERSRQYAAEALESGRRYRLPREQAEAAELLAHLGETP